MNQIFSFKRYAWLVKRQLVENAAIYKYGIGLLIGLIALFFWLFSNWKSDAIAPSLGHIPVLFITGSFFLLIFSGNFFESIGSKNKGMFYFSLPVSPLERVAVAFTFVMILFPALFLLIFSAFDYCAVQAFNSIHHTNVKMIELDLNITGIYALLISAFALGSFMFGKNGMIKTGLSLFALVLVYFGLTLLIFRFILNGLSFGININSNDIRINDIPFNDLFTSAWYLLIPLFWIILYFKIKEKEV
ncbi:MAG: hypothetical protein LBN37_05615 [Bacteroidales bacterium]|jgi:hypothetical protein|nr:hypothetical protein [Bacteroidales bacterium]